MPSCPRGSDSHISSWRACQIPYSVTLSTYCKTASPISITFASSMTASSRQVLINPGYPLKANSTLLPNYPVSFGKAALLFSLPAICTLPVKVGLLSRFCHSSILSMRKGHNTTKENYSDGCQKAFGSLPTYFQASILNGHPLTRIMLSSLSATMNMPYATR